MLRFILPALIAGLLAIPAAHAADCAPPPEPAIPDGASASRQDMIAASQAVKAYVTATQGYIDCLTVAASLIPPDGRAAAKDQAMSKRHNSAVDEMNRVASQFSQAVGAFKARVESTNGKATTPGH